MKTAVLHLRRGAARCTRYPTGTSRVFHTSNSTHFKQHDYDVIIVGGGHNGLVAAAYLAKAGKSVCVCERRPILGGAAVTEEIIPGFKFSRASYVYSLFRPHIVRDLGLKSRGLELQPRVPSSFTPTPEKDGLSLTLGGGLQHDIDEISQVSPSTDDAASYIRYNNMLDRYSAVVRPLLDLPPPDLFSLTVGQRSHSLGRIFRTAKSLTTLAKNLHEHVGFRNIPELAHFMLSPASTLLEQHFTSELLQATLATDAVIGSLTSPYSPQTAYVLLHHAMCGSWYNPKGGMGAVTRAIADAGKESGVTFRTGHSIKKIVTDSATAPFSHSMHVTASENGMQAPRHTSRVTGVELETGEYLRAPVIVANCAPQVAFSELLAHDKACLPSDFVRHVNHIDNKSGVVKINVALDGLPTFKCRLPTRFGLSASSPAHMRGTIHFETSMQQIHQAYLDASQGKLSSRPLIEMTIPSTLDPSVAPPGKHVALLFCQYAPYQPVDPISGKNLDWDADNLRQTFANRVFDVIEEYAPGFRNLILGYEALAPPDLERIFGLPGGNIFHSSMSLNQMFTLRPAPHYADYRTPIQGLYMASAGCHPGGGVMGAPGHNAAIEILRDLGYTDRHISMVSSAAL